MSDRHRIQVKPIIKSKAKFARIIPLKSFVDGEPLEISHQFTNTGDHAFPGADIEIEIMYLGDQAQIIRSTIPPLPTNGTSKSEGVIVRALADGSAYFMIGLRSSEDLSVDMYREGEDEPFDYYRYRSATIHIKTWEEFYQLWAMIIAAVSLAFLALKELASILVS